MHVHIVFPYRIGPLYMHCGFIVHAHSNFPTVNAIDFLFSTPHTTPFHYGETYFGALHLFLADATRSDTPKPPHRTSSGRSIQIASNSACTYKDPVAIDVFSSLIFILSVTEIHQCKVNAHFPLDCTIFACSILPIHNKFFVPPISPLN